MGAFLLSMIPIGIGVSIFYLVYHVSKRNSAKISNQFLILAEDLHLDANIPEKGINVFKKQYPSLEGTIDGKTFYAFMYTTGSGKNQQIWTAFRIATNNPGQYTLKLYQEGIFSKLGKNFGLQDIQVGDKPFDDSFMIKSNNEGFVQRLFDEDLKIALIRELPSLAGSFSLKGDLVEYSAKIQMTKDVTRIAFQNVIKVGSLLSDKVSASSFT